MEVSPQPRRGGYQHPDALFIKAVEAQWNAAPPSVPMTRAERTDFYRRDVGASNDVPRAEVREDQGTVTIEVDSKTAAVLMYAARLMCANYETHALEVRRFADQLPQGSYGCENRIEIAQRQERLAQRLRILDFAYRQATNRDFHGL
jgi:hypothetical protein